MASSTPTRRVLSDLNVNTPTARAAMQPSKLEASSSVKPRNVGDISSQAEIKQDARGVAERAAVRQETWMGSNKRCSDVSSDGLPNKRVKTTSRPKVVSEIVLPDPRGGQTFGSGIDDAPVLQSPPLRQTVVHDTRSSPSVASSPASSLGSRQTGLDDSQNTTITEPDDVPLPAALLVPTLAHSVSVPLAMEEIREKAEALRLRLKLASYKVRTNQIDVPLSRLQIKTLSSTSPELPRLPRVANTSQRRIPLPSSSTVLPEAQLQTPSAEKRPVHHARVASSPPPYLEITKHSPTKERDATRGGENEGCTTPILPRQRQGMLHPPQLGSPIWNEATSSVVKSRAANGLLELMRQQN